MGVLTIDPTPIPHQSIMSSCKVSPKSLLYRYLNRYNKLFLEYLSNAVLSNTRECFWCVHLTGNMNELQYLYQYHYW